MKDEKLSKEIVTVITAEKPTIQQVQEVINKKPEELVAAITGAIASGPSGLAVSAGRLVQGALRGEFARQFAFELNDLIDKGKIPGDFATKKFGFKSFTEVFAFIEQEDIDEDRFNAVKRMFFVMNSNSTDASKELLNYELLKISKSLTASQIKLLQSCFSLVLNGGFFHNGEKSYTRESLWAAEMSKIIGHHISTLVLQDEKILRDKGLLDERPQGDGGLIRIGAQAGLTDLGMAFCKNLDTYEESQGVDSNSD